MPTEQFIQDAICQGLRLEKLVRELGKSWTFDPVEDYVNQEYSFVADGVCGRIDVIGTFNKKRKLAIVEVKAGTATDEAADQLRWYIDHWTLLKMHKDLQDAEEIVGILLAEEFLLESKFDDFFPVEFDLSLNGFPFRRAVPSHSTVSNVVQVVDKRSKLHRLEDHVNHLSNPKLKQAFRESAHLFVDPSSDRAKWICINPKGGHVAIHYKGVYLAWFFVHKNWFHFGYRSKTHDRNDRITAETWDERKPALKSEIEMLMNQVDQQSDIPSTFSWAD